MAGRFEALDALLDEYLELPVPGRDGELRTWRIPSPPAEDGLRVDRIVTLAARLRSGTDPDADALSDAEELDLYRLALSDVYDDLAANVSWAWLKHVAMTAVIWITANEEAAARYWSAAGDPNRLAPNRATRRSSGASASAAASGTRSRGSTSGTRAASSKKPSPRAAKAAAGK
ncbi:DUF7426 family protein [Streptomyces sp. NPDC002644]